MFLTRSSWLTALRELLLVAIPSNRVNVSYLVLETQLEGRPDLSGVAIPSNRVNVSYMHMHRRGNQRMASQVAIPSNRVNVSYIRLTSYNLHGAWPLVAIPSNRVNVSYFSTIRTDRLYFRLSLSQSPQIGSMFLTPSARTKKDGHVWCYASQSPQIGSMFLTAPIFFYGL